MGTGGPFPGGNARPWRDADHSPYLEPRLRMSRSYTSSHPKRLHGVQRDHFFFFFYKVTSEKLVVIWIIFFGSANNCNLKPALFNVNSSSLLTVYCVILNEWNYLGNSRIFTAKCKPARTSQHKVTEYFGDSVLQYIHYQLRALQGFSSSLSLSLSLPLLNRKVRGTMQRLKPVRIGNPPYSLAMQFNLNWRIMQTKLLNNLVWRKHFRAGGVKIKHAKAEAQPQSNDKRKRRMLPMEYLPA
jgi:hypothetical protein